MRTDGQVREVQQVIFRFLTASKTSDDWYWWTELLVPEQEVQTALHRQAEAWQDCLDPCVQESTPKGVNLLIHYGQH